MVAFPGAAQIALNRLRGSSYLRFFTFGRYVQEMTFSDRFHFLAALTARRRWAWLAIFAVAAPTAYLIATGERAGAIFAAAFADPLSVLVGRSPGARGPGAVTQTKPNYVMFHSKRVPRGRSLPSERVLANIRTRPDELLGQNDLFPPLGDDFFQPLGGVTPSPFLITPQSEMLPNVSIYSPTLAGATPFNGIGVSVPIVAGGGEAGEAGEGGETLTPVNPDVPLSVTPAVPEPSTWMMFIVGFFGIGAGLRYRRRAQAGPASTV